MTQRGTDQFGCAFLASSIFRASSRSFASLLGRLSGPVSKRGPAGGRAAFKADRKAQKSKGKGGGKGNKSNAWRSYTGFGKKERDFLNS